MEALRNVEDKLKLTTQESIILLVFTAVAVAVVGLCTATVLKKKKVAEGDDEGPRKAEPSCNWASIKKMILLGSLRWSGAKKWEETSIGRGWKDKEPPLLLALEESLEAGGVGWQSHNSTSPVWQRPILMGEKCELPRFSGLILYDQSGKPLEHSLEETSQMDHIHQEKPVAVVRTTLKDLL